MKKISIILILIFMMQAQLKAQKPEALSGYEFEFPDYKIDATDNNIQMILLRDDQQPITSLRMIIGGGISAENKPGVADLTAAMLTKGAGGLSALEIAKEIDGIGANLSINSNDDMIVFNLEVLNKHLDKALSIFQKIVNQPKFDDDELDKLKALAKASIVADKANPNSLANKLSKLVIYGENHPYSQYANEEDIDNIEVGDLKNYYNKVLHARNMSLAIYGDYDKESIEKIVNTLKDISDNKETTPLISVKGSELMPSGVYFIPRSGSVQSTMRVLFPAPSYGDLDYEKLSFNGNIIGASFTGRLFKTLREKYAYTYTPSAGVTQRKNDNYFYAAADVKESVTDSAISVTLEQIYDLSNSVISNEELSSIKKYKIGRYKMNFENASFIVSMLQNAEFKGKKARSMESYIDRMEGISNSEVKGIAKKFLNETNVRIIVVGPESVRDKLTAFGKIYEYDKNIEENAGLVASELDADELIRNYVKAIEGSKDIDDIETLLSNGVGTATMAGNNTKITTIEYRANGGNLYQKIDFSGTLQEKWISNNKSWVEVAGMKNEMPMTDAIKLESRILPIPNLEDMGYSLKVLGKKDNMVVLEAVSPSGGETTYLFDASTYLLLGFSSIEQSPQGQIDIETKLSDYKEFDGIKFPSKIQISSPMFSYEIDMNYSVNKKEDYSFEPSK